MLTLTAPLLPEIRRYSGGTAAACAFYLALVSLAAHPDDGSLNHAWSLASMAWAIVLTAAIAATMPRRATASHRQTRADSNND